MYDKVPTRQLLPLPFGKLFLQLFKVKVFFVLQVFPATLGEPHDSLYVPVTLVHVLLDEQQVTENPVSQKRLLDEDGDVVGEGDEEEDGRDDVLPQC